MLKFRLLISAILLTFITLAIVPSLTADTVPITPGVPLLISVVEGPVVVELHLDKATTQISIETSSTGQLGTRFKSDKIDAFFATNIYSFTTSTKSTGLVVEIRFSHADQSLFQIIMTNPHETDTNTFTTQKVSLDDSTINAIAGDLSVQIQNRASKLDVSRVTIRSNS
jgi:hypothetical protein